MNHKELEVWKRAMGLAKGIYEETRAFPSSEMYGLTSQLRRAGVSVPSNIAEGAARGTDCEFVRFLRISLGSLAELETQLLLSIELGYIQGSTPLLQVTEDTRRMLLGLIRHLENKS